ncbi:MAG: DUF1294 domain-containing protein [Oscillospiraceae bacterium]|nr:DUF1294 domain-containing protein [Oscillospiraceae bacterium]
MKLYLILINALGLVLMLLDKRYAIQGKRRIPEATLMGVAAVGGSVGVLLGMYLFRHKTKKPKFYVGVPLILLAQAAVWYFFFR